MSEPLTNKDTNLFGGGKPMAFINPNETRVLEIQGIIINARYKIEKALKERNAFDENTATDAQEAKVNFVGVLDLMERGGLIARTADGKVFMTQKGLEKQIKTYNRKITA
jgi:hypothetical protein